MTQISGTAAGVPFVALPPDGAPGTEAPAVILWHLLGAPGTPAAMAASLPLEEVPAWRIYLELPGTGTRPGTRTGSDLLVDAYAPIVEQAVAELPQVIEELRRRYPITDDPVALVGGSGGGHAALTATLRAPIPIATTAVINPAVRAESVLAVNERAGGIEYHWSEESRAAAKRLDLLATEFPEIPLLLITGAEEYPEFQPDQKALHDALADRGIPIRHRIIDGLAHMFAAEPGLLPAPPTPEAQEIDREISAWLRQHG